MQSANLTLKSEDYVSDLLEEFKDYRPEITKTERSRNLRRNKEGSFIITAIKVKIYLGTERSMIIRDIEETTEIREAQNLKRQMITKKYSRQGELEWTREHEPEVIEIEQKKPERDERTHRKYVTTLYHEPSTTTYEVPSYEEAVRNRSDSHSSSSSSSSSNSSASNEEEVERKSEEYEIERQVEFTSTHGDSDNEYQRSDDAEGQSRHNYAPYSRTIRFYESNNPYASTSSSNSHQQPMHSPSLNRLPMSSTTVTTRSSYTSSNRQPYSPSYSGSSFRSSYYR